MKRIFVLTVCLMLSMFMLAACGDDEIYDRPGNGTTLGTPATEPPINDDNGSYSADPDGEVSQTTDNDGILEDGMDDVEKGVDDIEDGIDQGMDDLGDMADGNGDAAGAENGNTAADSDNAPVGDGSTNGNSH